jgi:putative FmdB family regulatory protein
MIVPLPRHCEKGVPQVPTYVYACRECEERLEVVQKMSDAPLTECPKCPGTLRRVLFAPAVVYKGSGFYTTDYKNGGSKTAAATGGEGKPADASVETKTETKTETAPAKSEDSSPASPAPTTTA